MSMEVQYLSPIWNQSPVGMICLSSFAARYRRHARLLWVWQGRVWLWTQLQQWLSSGWFVSLLFGCFWTCQRDEVRPCEGAAGVDNIHCNMHARTETRRFFFIYLISARKRANSSSADGVCCVILNESVANSWASSLGAKSQKSLVLDGKNDEVD